MCLVDVLTKYEGDRSSFEILSPDNGIPLKNLGLTPLTEAVHDGFIQSQLEPDVHHLARDGLHSDAW